MAGQYTNSAGQGVGYQAVAYAAQLLGLKYVYGGNTLAGVDCSGLTQLVYDKVGIQLPRTTQEQATAGVAVSPTALQPGDLILYNEPGEGADSHVAIYAGGGQTIVAPHTGTVVQYQPVDWAHFAGARRVTGGTAAAGSSTAAGQGVTAASLGTATQAQSASWWNPLSWGSDVADEVKTLAISVPILLGAVAILVVGLWKSFDLPKPSAIPIPV